MRHQNGWGSLNNSQIVLRTDFFENKCILVNQLQSELINKGKIKLKACNVQQHTWFTVPVTKAKLY